MTSPPSPPRGEGDGRAWSALEAELTPIEQDHRRMRIGSGGARSLSPVEFGAALRHLRAAVALYLGATEPLRARMCDFFRRTDRLASMLEGVTSNALSRIASRPQQSPRAGSDAARALEVDALEALGAVSLAELGMDYRDTYMALGALYLALETRGVRAGPLFAQVAALSSAEASRGGTSSTRDFLHNFERSAYFRSSVAPRLGGAGLP